MGDKWRMPTKDDMLELIANTTNSCVLCDVEYESKHTTMVCHLFVSKKDPSKKLFIPSAGCYDSDYTENNDRFNHFGAKTCVWTSSYDNIDPYNYAGSFSLQCNSNMPVTKSNLASVYRRYLYSVRGVCK